MSLRELKVLMWKHALIRKRRFIHTVVELFSPLMFFVLIIFLSRKVQEMGNSKNAQGRSEVMRLIQIRSSPYKIMYHPESLLTNSLMDDVGAKLNLQRLVSESEQMHDSLPKEILLPKKAVPPQKQLPPIPAYKHNTTISKTTKEIRRDKAKLAKLTHGEEDAKRVVAEQARLAREAEEEAARIEKQREEEKRMVRIAAGFLADPLMELVEEEQFEWDHADERLVAEGVQAAKGEKATAVTVVDIKQAPGEGIQLIDKIISPLHWIMYQPESLLTNSLMDDVGAKVELQRLSFIENRPDSGYFPLSKVFRLSDIANDLQMTEAVVIFHDMSRRSWPNQLNYTIRMKNAFHTETYEAPDDDPGPHKDYGIEYGTFLRIQWAIDTSYIKRLTGNDVPVKLSVQEFSDKSVKMNPTVAAVITMARFMILVSLILTFVFHMIRLVQERTSGVQELMKSVGVSLNTLGLSHFLNVLPCGLIFAIGGTILLKVTSNPVVPKTSAVLICLVLFLYFNTVISLAFVCSYITRRTQYAATLAILTYIVLFLPVRFLAKRQMPSVVKLATGLLPHIPMFWFWDEVSVQEAKGSGANFGNMAKAHSKKNFSVLISIIFMIIQIIMYYLLAWYLSLVRPGHYGQARPWNFCCKRKKNAKLNPDEEEREVITTDPRYFEPTPPNSEVGINILNVSKVYPQHRALKNVSLEVLKGDITVLVGHNGAGKTTLMSIITGMTSATEGKVYVNGMDTVTDQKEVRKNIGLCPQHNLFFDNLTVQEHIMFFTLLKHGTFAEAQVSSRKLAERLSLTEKLASMPKELSGGMKRRTQLACALAGGANVLVLDEPTSGLDVETRRELWDLLLSLRGERTVLLSTHFMEEADALGDRVAALHAGVLRCNATTMHLKKAMGTGYRLSLTTVGAPKIAEISAVVKSHVPQATLKAKSKNSISFNLPASQSGNFPELFAELEAKRAELRLDSIGVGVTTLEEVFLKLCSDVDRSLYEDEVDATKGPAEPPPKKLTGFLLYIRQLFVLLKRQVKYAIHKLWIFLLLNFVVPILVILMATSMSNLKPPKDEATPRALPMNLDMYGDRQHNRLLYHVEGPHVTQADVNRVQARYPKVTFEKTDDVANTILRIGQRDVSQYNKYLAGLEVNETDAKVLYTTTVRHAAPVALNLLSNMLAGHYTRRSDGNTITTINDPIITELSEQDQSPKEQGFVLLYGLLVIYIVMATNINSISLPCQERLTGSRHIHIMSGCPAELHWLATLSFHITVCVLGAIIPIVIAAYFLDKDKTINQIDFLVAFTVILFLGSLTLLAFGYLVSFNFGERGTSVFLVAFSVIFGFITPSTLAGYEMMGEAKGTITYRILLLLDYIVPHHTMAMTGLRCVHVAQLNAMCKLLRKTCPQIALDLDGFDNAKCCAGKNPRCYFCIDKYSPGKGMIILVVQFLIMMITVILTERRFFNGLVNKVMNRGYKPVPTAEQDGIVLVEKEYVRRAIAMPVKDIPDAMLVDDLHKTYVPFCRKKVNAVKGVSFSVKKGECFGLLGVNGAGKSTCFKMITAEESATRGNIYSNGHHLRRGASRYLQTLGYCPQFFGLDMFQTGEENLAMVLTLRGYDRQQVEAEVKNWIHIVGLEKYARNPVESYSGGCVRRLGAAAALCGNADLSLLDEPSAGVDVAARRRLWTALRKALKRQRSIVISSHSMDEMEALCSRIAILSGGRVRALGTAAGLRAAHAQGHAVVFKISQAQKKGGAGSKTEIDRFKAMMQEIFNCTLRDEHKTMLHYHINETMQYSELFYELESLRAEFPSLIEDYSVTETTLEEVFLSFAKEQHEQQQQHGPQAV